MPIGSDVAEKQKGPIYVETSALVKLYFPEDESDSVNDALRGRRDVVISELAVTEMVSALARRHREGSLDAQAIKKAYRAVLHHVQDGIFECIELSVSLHRQAERFLLATRKVPLRAADAVHIALALSVRAKVVMTFDNRFADAARTAKIIVLPYLPQEPAPRANI